MVNARLVISLVVLTIVVAFAVQNAEVVEVKLLFWTASLSRALLLFLVFIGGLLTG